jgi:hypothetical protein
VRLWKRAIEVTVGTTQITGLRMAFKVMSNLRGEPNTAELRIWNLSADTRAKTQAKGLAVRIMAGYLEGMGQVFLGTMRDPSHVREGVDIVTTLTAGDGDAVRGARINETLARGAKVGDAMASAAKKLGVSADDAIKKLRSGDIRGGLEQFIGGTTLSGSAWGELQRLVSASGLEASIQGGQLQVLDRGQATADQAVRLAVDSGLIGSPEPGKDGETKVRSLLQPGIYPGRKIKVESLGANGFYRAEVVTHSGDTHGPDWYTDIEARPL